MAYPGVPPGDRPAGRRVQYAALPYRIRRDGEVQIRLITSRETRRWVIPKGWPMKHLSPAKAAARETYEEAGLMGQVAREPLGMYTYEKRLGTRSVLCDVLVFPLKVKRYFQKFPEQAQRFGFWFSVESAAAAVQEEELKALILSFGDLVARKTVETQEKLRKKRAAALAGASPGVVAAGDEGNPVAVVPKAKKAALKVASPDKTAVPKKPAGSKKAGKAEAVVAVADAAASDKVATKKAARRQLPAVPSGDEAGERPSTGPAATLEKAAFGKKGSEPKKAAGAKKANGAKKINGAKKADAAKKGNGAKKANGSDGTKKAGGGKKGSRGAKSDTAAAEGGETEGGKSARGDKGKDAARQAQAIAAVTPPVPVAAKATLPEAPPPDIKSPGTSPEGERTGGRTPAPRGQAARTSRAKVVAAAKAAVKAKTGRKVRPKAKAPPPGVRAEAVSPSPPVNGEGSRKARPAKTTAARRRSTPISRRRTPPAPGRTPKP